MKIGIVTLGCDKNSVDAEYLAGALEARGHLVAGEGAHDAIDVLVLFTCGFIEAAREQSVATLLGYVETKRRLGNPRRLVMVGCLSQRWGEEMRPELPDVDAFAGVGDPDDLADLVEQVGDPDYAPDEEGAPGLSIIAASPSSRVVRPVPRKRLDAPWRAYVKIADGCDHTCSFCAIPLMKGPYASVPKGIILDEARDLVSRGVKEISLIAQDLAPYGRDLYSSSARSTQSTLYTPPRPSLVPAPSVSPSSSSAVDADQALQVSLLQQAPPLPRASARGKRGKNISRVGAVPAAVRGNRDNPALQSTSSPRSPGSPRSEGSAPYDLPDLLGDLCRIEGDFWIRLLYLYPAGLTPRFIEVFAREDKICKYLDIPLQHLDPAILRAMRRPDAEDRILPKIDALRRAVPDVALRTSIVVGFPGETDDAFDRLLDGVERIGFDWLGGFVYSPEEGTDAAAMKGRPSRKKAERRLDRLMQTQARITADIQSRQVGRTLRVLVESVDSPESVDSTDSADSPSPNGSADSAGPPRPNGSPGPEGPSDYCLLSTAYCRSYREAPEIDGLIHVVPSDASSQRPTEGLKPGDFATVRITDSEVYDLVGEIADTTPKGPR
ncbi:radical SAM protein [Candidatus Sumerlaeota bacterium]|nr:radical SAM protein [Candidatus Sumerlaeota bacterium]